MAVETVYIGYDTREREAAQICAQSLLRHTSVPLNIKMLREPALRHSGLYTREWAVEGGQKYDKFDGKPFSTDFSFSRFLVPSLMMHEGRALFVDCDFLFTSDVAELFDLFDKSCAAQVVKHDQNPSETHKMDGVVQTRYFRKNWSSLVLWNCGHKANMSLTPREMNTRPGQWLHAFAWMEDHEIGALPATWNWLSGVNKPLEGTPKAIHYTLGVPTMEGCEGMPLAELWHEERRRFLKKSTTDGPASSGPFLLEG